MTDHNPWSPSPNRSNERFPAPDEPDRLYEPQPFDDLSRSDRLLAWLIVVVPVVVLLAAILIGSMLMNGDL